MLGAVSDASGDFGPIEELEAERHELFSDGVKWEEFSSLMNQAGKVAMLDTSQPAHPRLVRVLDLGAGSGPHYLRLTEDERRLVISDYFLNEDSLFAFLHDGQPIPLEHGGPVRLIIPQLYAWKSAKWVRGVRFLSADQAGFWEEGGYHMRGNPWIGRDGERFRW